MNIFCKTWKKDADDLFDLEANDVIKKEFKITEFNLNSKFFLVYYNDKINLINSYEYLIEKYKESQNKTKDMTLNRENNNFLIITEFQQLSLSPFCFCSIRSI